MDDAARRRRIDTEDVLRAFSRLPDQAAQAWTETRRLPLAQLRGVRRVVVTGMGGSALGPHVIRSVYRDTLKIPFEIVNGYALPGGVGRDTLVIASSYSGSTEETLAATAEAKKRGAKIVGITRGGKLAALLKKYRAPAYVFRPKANPGDRPRMALGYSVFGILGLLHAARILPGITPQVTDAILTLQKSVARYGADVPHAKNPAKKLAVALKERVPIVVGAEHLEGSAHVLANQVNETGKAFAAWFPIPELNHHLMEGLGHPRPAVKRLSFVFLGSSLYRPRVQRRFALTADVVKKNGARAIAHRSGATTRLGQAADLLAFGGAATYYLGILHGEDPSPNPWVDLFKRRLGT